jgi:hypothetical protein
VSRSRTVTVRSVERVAVDGEAEGAAGLVHAGVALADGLLLVELDRAEVPNF